MTLKFYCRPLPGSESLGPLLATASIPRLKADQIDARDYSTVERFSPDTTPYLVSGARAPLFPTRGQPDRILGPNLTLQA